MQASIQPSLPALRQALAQHSVEQAYLFGSFAKGTATAGSDVDVLVRFQTGLDYEAYADNYFSLLHALRRILRRDVDLMAEETLRNPYLCQSIDAHKIRLL